MRCAAYVVAVGLAFGLATVASAQSKRSGDWEFGVMEDAEGVYAATMNDSSGVLGQYCITSSSACYWVLVVGDVDCDEGSTYPVLVNGEKGASHHEIYCMKLRSKARFAFKDFDAFDSMARGAGRIGIAFPMKSGLFQVSRFSLSGSTYALDSMREIASQLVSPSKSTRDQRL